MMVSKPKSELQLGEEPLRVVPTTLELNASPSVVGLGEEVTLYGRLHISKSVGDVNDDGRVDLYDYYMVCMCYGWEEGMPGYEWCADYDIDEDGKVDLYDVYTVASYFGIDVWGKKIKIQRYDPSTDSWIDEFELKADENGYFEVSFLPPQEVGVYYYRAYFPGGTYPS